MAEASKNEQSGAALTAFIAGLSDSQEIVDKLLADAGIDRIDPEGWYDFDWAASFFRKIEEQLGRAAIIKVGRSMVETASYPPEIDDARALLSSLGQWFALHARGPEVGTITTEWEDDYTALIVNSVRGSCAFNIGIMEGACARYGITPLIEHGADGCKEEGAEACVYRVSW